jgi:uncharacterized membrane protein YGL010W
MHTLESWFNEYSESHQNPLNKRIHFICVPVIYFSVIALLYVLSPWLCYLGIALTLAFYARLSKPLAIGMLVANIIILVLIHILPALLSLSLILFVLAWIGQFYGHHIEGKKPSFFKDLQFLLIGPLWVLGFLYKKWNIAV